MNIQDWFPLRLSGWIALQSKGHSQEFYPTPHLGNIMKSTSGAKKFGNCWSIALKDAGSKKGEHII